MVGGAGILALSGGAAASDVNIEDGSTAISNDRGDLSRLAIDPTMNIRWSNFDDAVGKVFFLIEAKVGDGSFHPVYRATPWLSASQMGTTGTLDIDTITDGVEADPRWTNEHGSTENPGITLADEDGRPDYSALSFPSGVDYESFMDGTSMGGADNYPAWDDDPAHQNNFPAIDAGYYGAAADTSAFDNDDDQTMDPKYTDVTVRYTIEFQRPNVGQMQSATGLSTTDKAELAAEVDSVEPSDIDAGNSRIVMSGEDGYTDFGGYSDGAGIPYDTLQQYDSHPGIIAALSTVTVGVTNETSDGGVTGDNNAASV